MKICLTIFPWHNHNNIWVTGFIRTGERYLTGNDLAEYFKQVDSALKFEQTLKSANGQFSVIISTSSEIWAATDRLRNFPLFYSCINGEYFISDDCYTLAEIQPERQFNDEAVNSFLSAGYTVNNLTLLNNIFQVEAGEYVILGDSFSRRFYFRFFTGVIIGKDLKTASMELLNILKEVFGSHLKALSDKYIAISLSGGFDSRLIAAMCAEHHPENILCYTYGIRNNNEAKLAERAANRMGLKWVNIVYDSELVKGFLLDDIFNKYYHYAAGLSSMFYMQDYFAIKYLKANKLVPDGCVFITGFSGDMLAGNHLIPEMNETVSRDRAASLILMGNFNLIHLTRRQESQLLRLINCKISEAECRNWTIFENWDQKERQAKFIINSAKVFSFFGYSYVLPLWDNLLNDYFSSLPFELKLDKRLYDFVLTEYFFKDRDLNFADEINPSSSIKAFQRIKGKIKRFLPGWIKELFIKHQSTILYDEITEILVKDSGSKSFIKPVQSNFYNSFITQWYLKKIKEHLNIK